MAAHFRSSDPPRKSRTIIAIGRIQFRHAGESRALTQASFFTRSQFSFIFFPLFLSIPAARGVPGNLRKSFRTAVSRHLVSRLHLIKGEERKGSTRASVFRKTKRTAGSSFARLFNFRVIEVNYKPRVVPRKIAEGNLTACVSFSLRPSLGLSHACRARERR